MNFKRCLALLLCAAMLLSMPVAAARDTVLLTRAPLQVPAPVLGESLLAPSFAEDAAFRMVSYQWYRGNVPVSEGSTVEAGDYTLTVTVRIKDAGANHVDQTSYISTDGLCTALGCTVDADAGAITGSFRVPVFTASSASVSLPELQPEAVIADTLYETLIAAGEKKPETVTLLIYDGERYIGTGMKTEEDFFVFSDAAACLEAEHNYTVLGTAIFDKEFFHEEDLAVSNLQDGEVELLGGAGSFGFRWAFTCPAAPVKEFDDVDAEKWYYEGIQYCVGRGLMNGMSKTIFSPEKQCNRAMLVSILYRLEGAEEMAYSPIFKDVPANTWYTDGVLWAEQNGIVNGLGNNRFGPEDPLTREQFATIMMRYVAFKGAKTDARAALSSFPDASKVSNYAKDAMGWAVAEGLINGNAAGNVSYLQPQGNATRAECATILMRLCKRFDY